MVGRQCSECGAPVHALSKFDLCKKHNAARKQAKHGTDEKFCSECGKKLRIDNETGLCKGCKKGASAAPQPNRAVRKIAALDAAREQRKAKSSASPLPSAPEADALVAASESVTKAALLVTGDQLVRMFSAWPLEDQITCIQSYLDREVA